MSLGKNAQNAAQQFLENESFIFAQGHTMTMHFKL
jgi:hypothetical protein